MARLSHKIKILEGFFSNKSSVISFSTLRNIFQEDLQKLQLVQNNHSGTSKIR